MKERIFRAIRNHAGVFVERVSRLGKRRRPRVSAETLVEILHAMEVGDFEGAVQRFELHRAEAVRALRAKLAQRVPKELTATAANPSPNNEEWWSELLAKNQALAAIALSRLDQHEPLFSRLKHSHDDSVRSYLVNWAMPFGVDPHCILDQLKLETDPSIRRAMLPMLGRVDSRKLSPAELCQWKERLLVLYADRTDGGLHASSTWLLGQWMTPAAWDDDKRLRRRPRAVFSVDQHTAIRDLMAQIDQPINAAALDGTEGWYVNQAGMMMMILPTPGPLGPQTVKDPNEMIRHSFAIASTEVTKRQFQAFLRETSTNMEAAAADDGLSLERAQGAISWYTAAAFCNWLSEKDGIDKAQWCYRPTVDGDYDEGMFSVENSRRLAGYWMPTEAEWEFACQAGSTTKRHYGQHGGVVNDYGWYRIGEVVAQKLPNDFGLFDLHGNMMEWCEDSSAQTYNREAPIHSRDGLRILKSGTIDSLLTSRRRAHPPNVREEFIGLRPVRTLPTGEPLAPWNRSNELMT